MPSERRLRILEQLVGALPGEETKRLCDVCAEVTRMNGAGIMLMSEDGPRGSLCTSDEVSNLIEHLQYDLAEGPCVDAYEMDRPVLEPNLRDPKHVRWLGFRGPALDAGVGAVFGFPMHIGAVRIGALNLYRHVAGDLTDEQHADALVMAEVAAGSVLSIQAGAAPDALAAELEVGADFQFSVHQASGMVAAQLGVGVGQALVRMRAHAFGNGRRLSDVASDIVTRKLRFTPESENTDG